jgi:hypothetical protein
LDDEKYLDPVYYKMRELMGIFNDTDTSNEDSNDWSPSDEAEDNMTTDGVTTTTTAEAEMTKSGESYQPSFILSFFDMYEDVFAQCFYALIIMVVIYRIIGYYCLKRNIRNRRL